VLLALELSLLFTAAFLVDFLVVVCFFMAGFDATVEEVEELCAAGAAAGLAGAVCAAKVKGRLAAVKAMANNVVFIFFLPAGLFSLPLTIPCCASALKIPIACAGYIERPIRVDCD
jgi:hypothetical protein